MIVILNKIEVITTYGKLLYEAINKEAVMKKIGNSIIPLRINNRPELVVITLYNK